MMKKRAHACASYDDRDGDQRAYETCEYCEHSCLCDRDLFSFHQRMKLEQAEKGK
jgi:hypothetical protein